jgi:hypothetical protein
MRENQDRMKAYQFDAQQPRLHVFGSHALFGRFNLPVVADPAKARRQNHTRNGMTKRRKTRNSKQRDQSERWTLEYKKGSLSLPLSGIQARIIEAIQNTRHGKITERMKANKLTKRTIRRPPRSHSGAGPGHSRSACAPPRRESARTRSEGCLSTDRETSWANEQNMDANEKTRIEGGKQNSKMFLFVF